MAKTNIEKEFEELGLGKPTPEQIEAFSNLGKSIAAALSPVVSSWEEVMKGIAKHSDKIRAGIEVMKRDRQRLTDEFNRQFPAIEQFLRGQNKILPVDAEQFIYWFLYVKHGRLTPRELHENWPGITHNDFKLFHEYAKELFEQGGKVGQGLKPKREETEKKPKVRAYALYLYYSNPGVNSKEDLKAAANRFSVNPGSFVNEWYRVIKQDYRTDTAYLEDLRQAVELLEADGKPIDRANLDLQTAQSRLHRKK